MAERHCVTCTCESVAERKRREDLEQKRIERERREREFVQRHSVLTDEQLSWARAHLDPVRR